MWVMLPQGFFGKIQSNYSIKNRQGEEGATTSEVPRPRPVKKFLVGRFSSGDLPMPKSIGIRRVERRNWVGVEEYLLELKRRNQNFLFSSIYRGRVMAMYTQGIGHF